MKNFIITAAGNRTFHIHEWSNLKDIFIGTFEDTRPRNQYGVSIINSSGRYIPDEKRPRDKDGNIILGVAHEEIIDMAIAKFPHLSGQRFDVGWEASMCCRIFGWEASIGCRIY